jgi:hypothetical protein
MSFHSIAVQISSLPHGKSATVFHSKFKIQNSKFPYLFHTSPAFTIVAAGTAAPGPLNAHAAIQHLVADPHVVADFQLPGKGDVPTRSQGLFRRLLTKSIKGG